MGSVVKRLLQLVVSILALASPALGAVIHVPGDASTIPGALALAVNGDVILVSPGTYVGALVDGKNVAIVAEGGPCTTFITAPCPTGDGFAIRNCTAAEVRGFWIVGMPLYGIQLRGTVDAWIHDNVVVGSGSSGIDVPAAYPNSGFQIEHNTVVGNIYGVLIDGSPVGFVHHNVVWGNSSSDIGCFFDPANLEPACNLVGTGGSCISGSNTVHGADPFLGLAGYGDLRLNGSVGTPGSCGAIGAPLDCQAETFTISGRLTSSCGMSMAGVTIDLFDSNGLPVETAVTGGDGAYVLSQIASGAYALQIVTPLGFVATPPVLLGVTGDLVQDFSLFCIEVVGTARSQGYWKHNVSRALAGRTQGIQESSAALLLYSSLIFHHFFENLSNPIDVLNVTYEAGPAPLDLATLDATLGVGGPASMLQRANAQYLVLLLNVASEKLRTWSIVTDDARTCSQAIVYIANLINDGLASNDELAKTIADTINDGRRVAAGIIPESAPNVPFKGEAVPVPIGSELSAGPNPFNPTTTLHFRTGVRDLVTLQVIDVRGRVLRTLLETTLEPGAHSMTWDGRDDAGRVLPSGIYRVVREGGGYGPESRPVTLLK